MNIFIPEINWQLGYKRTQINQLIRPFLSESGELRQESGLNNRWKLPNYITLVKEIKDAHFILFPYPLECKFYFIPEKKLLTNLINESSSEAKVVCYIPGDFGFAYPPNKKIIYLRHGGFRSKETKQTLTMPVLIRDRFEDFGRTYNSSSTPIIGFCGNANNNTKEWLSIIKTYTWINLKRLVLGSVQFEPYFNSASKRLKILNYLERSSENQQYKTNFIYRNGYRGNAKNDKDRERTTNEYYQNMVDSTHVLCIRGTGNFSTRYWETIMMGRIPIVIDTDVLEGQLVNQQHINQLNIKLDELSELFSLRESQSYIKQMQQNRKTFENGLLSIVFNNLKKIDSIL